MTDYKIVSAFSVWGLEKKATKLLQEGYIPTGGVSKGFGKHSQAFYKIPPFSPVKL